MIFQRIDQKATGWSKIGLLLVVVSLGTSWALDTPKLTKKAETLDVVESTTLPKQAADLAKAKTDLKQANCDRQALTDVAAQGIAASHKEGVPAPEWSDLHGCATVAPVKAAPVSVPKL